MNGLETENSAAKASFEHLIANSALHFFLPKSICEVAIKQIANEG